jgi:hypothetical protein
MAVRATSVSAPQGQKRPVDGPRSGDPADRKRRATGAPLAEQHVRFIEHMLLEEHVACDRGNTVEKATAGFRAFWPHKVNFVERACVARVGDIDAELKRVLNAPFDADAAVASWKTATPFVVVVGPQGSSPHAVAFLVTEESGGRACYYANTGLGAEPFGSAIRTTLKWTGDTILAFVEFARTHALSDAQWTTLVRYIKLHVPGYDYGYRTWRPVVRDKLLTFAQYENVGGQIVAFAQRGATCSYNCVLWLIGGVLLSQEDALGAEKTMKRRAVGALAAYDGADRSVLRIMEAVAHVYARAAARAATRRAGCTQRK